MPSDLWVRGLSMVVWRAFWLDVCWSVLCLVLGRILQLVMLRDRKPVGVLQDVVGDQWPLLAMPPRRRSNPAAIDRVLAADLLWPPACPLRQSGEYEPAAGLVLEEILESGGHNSICTSERRHNPGSSPYMAGDGAVW